MEREDRKYFDERFGKLEEKIDTHFKEVIRIDKTVSLHSAILGTAGTISMGGLLAWIGSWFHK